MKHIELGLKLRNLRGNLPKAYIERESGICGNTLIHIENGRRMSFGNMVKLAKYYKADLNEWAALL